ncbi:hypothetical protein ACHAL6_00745 [Proteiniclasticum sp. C24MP]|uniref:hypothetical protein n=1 Tax=Proteiniclasticum sp. C24MP TaxID=3374101 RepID=UPI003754AAF0
MKTLLTRKELAERWGVNVTTIDRYEREGLIRKNKLDKFSLSSIEKIEYDGTDTLLSRKEREIQELKLENIRLRNKFQEIRGILG